MSEREMYRAGVLGQVASGRLQQVEAAAMLQLSYRQAKRLYRRYRRKGAKGMVHGNVGKSSGHAKPERLRKRALELVRKHYGGEVGERFGPTLAAEHLEEDHGLQVGSETLRRWMLVEGLWSRERRRKPYRQRRARKEHFGELVQMDGSFHDWLEQRGPRGCLIDMVDDATSRTLSRLGAEETSWAVTDALRAWVEEYGIPLAIYADWKNVYQHQPTERQRREGEVVISQFGRVCAKLGIQLIAARSPQAKGRVERNHGTHQDRLVKKLRLRKVCGYEAANQYLAEEYLRQHNAKYAVEPASGVDFHRPAPQGLDLETVFCLEQERVVGNDWVVRYESRLLQIERQPKVYVPAGSTIVVQQGRDGSLRLVYQGRQLVWREIEQVAPQPERLKLAVHPIHPPRVKPRADHPWRALVVMKAKGNERVNAVT